jgi:hypothetical protein
MRTPIVCVALHLLTALSHAQISEHFNASPPPWKGTDSAWQVQNGKLQSNCLQTNSFFYLYIPAAIGPPAVWEWWMQLNFNTSSNNYLDIYLVADSSGLLYDGISGYFVRIGGAADEVALYRKQPGNTVLKLIDGRDGLTDKSSSLLKLKVTCSAAGNWQLWTDTTGTGSNYVQQGVATDHALSAPLCYGIVIRQSTASFFQQHFFDDVIVGPLLRDSVPPELLSLTPLNSRELLLQFSEPPDTATSLLAANYRLGLSQPLGITQEGTTVRLLFSQPFPAGDTLLLELQHIADAAGNIMPACSARFAFYAARRYDVLIHEILPDPDPPLQQPLPEFVELRNNSAYPLQLGGWRLRAIAGEITLPPLLLEPDSLLLLCRQDKLALLGDSVRACGIPRFPTLANDEDTLTLYDAAGSLVHAIAYNKSWYAGAGKENGGWSLEMISPAAPCAGSTAWKPSVAPAGATPGRPNAVAGTITDSPPGLLRGELHDSSTINLYFSKTLDSLSASVPAAYRLSPGTAGITAATPLPPFFNEVRLQVSPPLEKGTLYTLQVDNIRDCVGRSPDGPQQVTLALPAVADSGAVLISEVLFDPLPLAPEFVEIYNHGAAAIDLQGLYIARLDEESQPAGKIQLAREQRLLLPGRYMALTRDPDALCRYYTCKAAENLLQLSSLPALPNEGGALALYNEEGRLLDKVLYSPDMQSSLAGNTKGVSLERLSFEQPGQNEGNWHAAAITAAYATPGSANSQRFALQELAGEVTIQPPVFSPDNDGVDDLAVIACRLPAAGFVGNILVFDAQGKPVRRLLQNGLLGNQANIVWDGRGENKQLLPVGIYIIFTEIFDPQGRIKRWKLPVVMARNLN